MFGFLLQWPTIITIIMFPILILMYYRLSPFEEKESEKMFGEIWYYYTQRVPAFIPNFNNVENYTDFNDNKKTIVKDFICSIIITSNQNKYNFTFEKDDYHFCYEECLNTFKMSPKNYINTN